MKKFRVLTPYLLISLAWLLSVTAKLKFNGLIFGFDYGLYHPDGVHYTLRTLVWLGDNPLNAAHQVTNWYAEHSAKHIHIDPNSILPENSPVWGLIKPRVLYPFVSMPFVALFGIPGMLVVPALSLLVTMFAIYRISAMRLSSWVSIGLASSVSLSTTILRWSVANLTDVLTMALFSFVPLILISQRKYEIKNFFLLLVIISTSLNRLCLPIWLALAFCLFLEKNKKSAFFVGVSSLLMSIPGLISGFSVGLLPSDSSNSTIYKLTQLPFSFARVAFIELVQLAVLDRILLLLLVTAMVFSVRKASEFASRSFLAVACSVWVLGAINGVLGVNFRYQLPVIPFAFWVMTENWPLGSLSKKTRRET